MTFIRLYAFLGLTGMLWTIGAALLSGLSGGLSGHAPGGLDSGADLELDLDASAELADAGPQLSDGSQELADPGFPFLSPHVLSSFFAGFGLAGWAAISVGAGLAIHLPAASVIGLLSGGLIGSFLHALRTRLSVTSGATPRDLLGQPARVSLPIPPKGSGAISLDAAGSRHSFAAVTADGAPLPLGAKVRIERIRSGTATVREHPRDRRLREGSAEKAKI